MLRLGAEPAAAEQVLGLASLALEKILEVRRLGEQAGLLLGALDRCGRASLLFDGSGAIVYANPQGDRLLSQQTETQLEVVSPDHDGSTLIGRLCRMADELATAGDAAPGHRGKLQLSDGTVVDYEISHLGPGPDAGRQGVLVTLERTDPSPGRAIDRFAGRYGLSNRESQVLRLLLEGFSTRRVAAELGISPHTVRDHVKNLYRKTGAGSRSQLVSLVAVLPPTG